MHTEFVRKPEGKRLLWGRWRNRKINLTEKGHQGVDAAGSGLGPVVFL
jgi:hypothetical protein